MSDLELPSFAKMITKAYVYSQKKRSGLGKAKSSEMEDELRKLAKTEDAKSDVDGDETKEQEAKFCPKRKPESFIDSDSSDESDSESDSEDDSSRGKKTKANPRDPSLCSSCGFLEITAKKRCDREDCINLTCKLCWEKSAIPCPKNHKVKGRENCPYTPLGFCSVDCQHLYCEH